MDVDNPLQIKDTYERIDGALSVVSQRSTVSSTNDVDCVWRPARVVLPKDATAGASWANDVECEYERNGQRGKKRVQESATLVRVEPVTFARRSVEGLVVRLKGTRTTSGDDDARSDYEAELTLTDGGLVLRSEEALTVSLSGQDSPMLRRRRVLELIAWP